MKSLLKKLRKTMAIIGLIFVAFPSILLATSTPIPPGGVAIESELAVSNATLRTGYHDSVNARIDDVVNLQVWYHNPNPVNSDKIARNVNVRITVPSTKTRTHTATSRVAGTNTNIVTDIATVNTSVNTNLRYIPGTAIRRYNAGTNDRPNWVTQSVSDSVVVGGVTIPQVRPCWNFQESITIQARVTAPVVTITKRVKIAGNDYDWQTNINVQPGTRLAYLITVTNMGNERLTNVIVRDSLPPSLNFVEGSALLFTSAYPNGYPLSDSLVNGGVNIGNLAPGVNAHVRFNAIVPETKTPCGDYRFTNVGVVRSDQLGDFYNTAIVNTNYICTQANGASLRVIKFHDRDGDRTEDGNEERLSGWRFRVTGNGINRIITTNSDGIAVLTDIDPGTYTVTEILTSGWTNTTGLSVQRNIPENTRGEYVFGNRRTRTPDEPVYPGGDITPTKLPSSGPIENAAMAFGTMSFSGAALAWARSKKKLLGAFHK